MTVAPLPATSHVAWANLGIVLDEPWNEQTDIAIDWKARRG